MYKEDYHSIEYINIFALVFWNHWKECELFVWSIVYSNHNLQKQYYYSIIESIIIIIMSRRLRGYPWPSLAISPYHSSPPAGLQDYNPCPHIAAVCKFVLVVPLLHIHEWGSTGVHQLWKWPVASLMGLQYVACNLFGGVSLTPKQITRENTQAIPVIIIIIIIIMSCW